jgi:uncharacterized protein (TIGR00725 family)
MRQKKLQIGVMGSDGSICSAKSYKVAREVGRELAKNDCITLTGGGSGVMEAACRGAKEKGGTTIGILPGHTKSEGNKYLDIVIVSGMGFARNMLNIKSCEGVIIIEGGAGTLTEAAYAYQKKIPAVAVVGTGGTADHIAGTILDIREHEKIIPVYSAKEAVDMVVKLAKKQFKRDLKNHKPHKLLKKLKTKKKK